MESEEVRGRAERRMKSVYIERIREAQSREMDGEREYESESQREKVFLQERADKGSTQNACDLKVVSWVLIWKLMLLI